MEVVALMHLAGMQPPFQNFMGKLVRRHQRKIAREGKQQHRVNPRGFQQPQLFRQRSQQLQSVIGRKMRAGCGSKVTTTECP